MSLPCRVGVWWWGCAAIGRRKWTGGDRLTEKGLVWGGSVALGRVDGRMRDGRKGAGLMGQDGETQTGFGRGGEGENEWRTYICV